MQKIFNRIAILIFFLTTACQSSLEDVKRGLGGGKRKTTDEFLVKKKDPLVLPPKWGDLPVPGRNVNLEGDVEEVTDIEELLQLGKDQKSLTNIKQGGSVEESLLKQLKQK